jgi:hypothetical protein
LEYASGVNIFKFALLEFDNRFFLQIVPFVYVLMSRKTMECYKHFLRFIDENLIPLNNESFITDYETATTKAIKTLFSDATVWGCWFHFCQNVRRKVAKLSSLEKNIRLNKEFARVYYQQLQRRVVGCSKIGS